MSTTKNDGGPAFPVPNDAFFDGQTGMSLRDWFAGQAPAIPEWFAFGESVPDLAWQELEKLNRGETITSNSSKVKYVAWSDMERLTRWRWSYADAMLEARK